MRNQHVIYSNSRVFESSSESQSPASQDETHGSREGYHKVALGFLCLLLMTAIVLWLTYNVKGHWFCCDIKCNFIMDNKHWSGYKQTCQDCSLCLLKTDDEDKLCSQEKYDRNNLYQSIRQNITSLNKTLTNESPEYEDCKYEKEQKRCCGKTNAVLDYGKYTGKCTEAHLFCCGIKCYYFIMDNKHWNDCKQTCEDCSLSLLKIDDDEELKFLMYHLTTNTFWIGLSYQISKSKWQWIDNGTSKLDLMKLKLLKENGGCACLSFRGIHEGDCATKHPCICKKRMDRFPDSMYSLKRK